MTIQKTACNIAVPAKGTHVGFIGLLASPRAFTRACNIAIPAKGTHRFQKKLDAPRQGGGVRGMGRVALDADFGRASGRMGRAAPPGFAALAGIPHAPRARLRSAGRLDLGAGMAGGLG